jgi:hypothetical protein
LTAGTSFAVSLYASQLILEHIAAYEEIEIKGNLALASADVDTLFELFQRQNEIDEDILSLSFEA